MKLSRIWAVAVAAVLALAPCAAFGQPVTVQGTGTAGNPAGGVLTVQGPAGGGGSGVTVTGNVGGYDSGTTPVQTFTAANSSHTAGKAVGATTATALGALISIPIARTNGGSGELEQLLVISAGGDTPTLQGRIWDKSPANTTCEDNTAFASSATDDAHLIVPPFSITPAVPAQTTGDSKTYVNYTWSPPLSFQNQDGTASKNIYVCLVTTGTFTPAAAAYYVDATGPQN